MSSYPPNPSGPSPEDQRLMELLADQALFGLGQHEAEELSQLDQSFEVSDDTFDIAVALVDLSMTKPERMPETLERKLMRQGRESLASLAFRAPRMAADHADSASSTFAEQAEENPGKVDQKKKRVIEPADQLVARSNRFREVIAWGTAAAIGFIALMVWNNGRSTVADLKREMQANAESYQSDNDKLKLANKDLLVKVEAASAEITSLSQSNKDLEADKKQLESLVIDLKEQLFPDGEKVYNRLVSAEGTTQWEWSPVEGTVGSGSVLWNQKEQRGVMRLSGLPENDPTTSQYQLWIIEAETERKHPVDGGVFDVKGSGEIYVPIDAKLVASNPKMFAVTIEKPSGVVVSDQGDKVCLVAQAPADDK